jgi:hypothetical protein
MDIEANLRKYLGQRSSRKCQDFCVWDVVDLGALSSLASKTKLIGCGNVEISRSSARFPSFCGNRSVISTEASFP